MKEYQTMQRKILLEFFQTNMTRKYSVDELLAGLPAQSDISRSAIYRNLDKMTRDGLLKRSISEEGRKAQYQYTPCQPHCDRIHLQCEKCGRTMHMKNKMDESYLTTMLQEYGFELDEHATVLVGVCNKCK